MKLVFSRFVFVLALLLPITIISKEVRTEYTVSTKGFKIGELVWYIKTENNYFENKIILKSGGLFSSLYKFSGEYFSSGIIEGSRFYSEKYYHKWLTKKKEKEMKIFFNNKKISSIKQKPLENEVARIDIFDLVEYSDPLTSFLNILNDKGSSHTVDGRRVYTMVKYDNLKIEVGSTILIKNYNNIWADHKRNDLEKINFSIGPNQVLPEFIEIHFKGNVFKVFKN